MVGEVIRSPSQAPQPEKEKQQPMTKIYEIIGEVDTVALKASYGETWRGLRLTPPFHIQADSQREAEDIAKQIIDPLQMCTMHITATEQPPLPSAELAELGSELDNIVDALNGDSNDDEHDALFAVGETIAKLLGVDLRDLLEGDGL